MIKKINRVGFLISFFIVMGSVSAVLADTGIFLGAGNQIIPLTNQDIQLVNETVQLSVTLPSNNRKYGLPFIPLINISAKFLLKNPDDKDQNVQMGFPFLDAQGFGDSNYILQNMKFFVKQKDKKEIPELKENIIDKIIDPNGMFKKIYVWNEAFKPQELKTVTVSYQLFMSPTTFEENTTLSDSLKVQGLSYYFMYITKPIYGFQKPTENARFQLDASKLFVYLKNPKILKELATVLDSKFSKPLLISRFNQETTRKNNQFFWNFSNNFPENGLVWSLIILNLTSSLSELKEDLVDKLKSLSEKEYARYIDYLLERYQKYGTSLLFKEDRKEVDKIIAFLEQEKLDSGVKASESL